ncbi:hypothetical protein WG66_014873 [Moniliophthora roreri]|uniref:Uncharacterized protein n=1 Tax=Moniliophthora roreri TaxID=221103 RepID=A0A0W0FEJ9_MONRR|nr:hypothetical protein WG66_014873 [Moniliophthora roreri]
MSSFIKFYVYARYSTGDIRNPLIVVRIEKMIKDNTSMKNKDMLQLEECKGKVRYDYRKDGELDVDERYVALRALETTSEGSGWPGLRVKEDGVDAGVQSKMKRVCHYYTSRHFCSSSG